MPGAGRLGDKSHNPADVHGCPVCAHPVTGPAISGSADVIINNKPALRIGDKGIHAACCGSNSWEASAGSGSVLINNQGVHRMGDGTQHCGGPGNLTEGSTDVLVGG